MKLIFAIAIMLLTSGCMTSYTTRGGSTFAVGAAPVYAPPPVYRPSPWWRRSVWRRGPYRGARAYGPSRAAYRGHR